MQAMGTDALRAFNTGFHREMRDIERMKGRRRRASGVEAERIPNDGLWKRGNKRERAGSLIEDEGDWDGCVEAF